MGMPRFVRPYLLIVAFTLLVFQKEFSQNVASLLVPPSKATQPSRFAILNITSFSLTHIHFFARRGNPFPVLKAMSTVVQWEREVPIEEFFSVG